jgi:tRNA modification GTPase
MSLPDSDDTIVAISTPPGYGGIGVVRISGKQAFSIAGQLVREDIDLSAVPSHTLHHCYLKGEGESLIDEAVLGVFRGPHSYTGQDVVEISAHGNPQVLHQIVREAINLGARQALPGEFTLRAFQS